MLSLLAVFAVGAVASASASAAAPEFFHCVTKAGGKFAAGCLVEGTTSEKVAVPEGSSIEFTSVSEPGYLFANASGTTRIRCGIDTDKGEITGPKRVAGVTVTFKECKGFKGTEECSVNSKGAAAGTVVTNTLSGELGIVLAAEAPDSEVGLSLKPTTGAVFVELEGSCIVTTKVEGSVIGEVEPVKTMDKTGELIYSVKASAKNKQGIQKFEPGAKDTLTAFGGAAGLETQDSITFKENIEVT